MYESINGYQLPIEVIESDYEAIEALCNIMDTLQELEDKLGIEDEEDGLNEW